MTENTGIEAPGTVHIPMQDVFDAYRAYVTTPLGEVHAERQRQDALFSEQNHPVHDPTHEVTDRGYYAMQADLYRQGYNARKASGRTAWDFILMEEVYEALAEEDPARQREELIQVAAVAVAMVESLDRAQAKASE